MLDRLFELLPEDGAFVGFETMRTALSEGASEDVSAAELHRLIFALGGQRKVDWLPREKQLGRTTSGRDRHAPWPIERERDLEPWVERYLWLNSHRFYDPPPPRLSLIVENTARTATEEGRWTRPDLSVACVARYRFQPAPLFDLFTFELKMPSGCNMLAVHEALAHSASSNFAFLCIYLPSEDRPAGFAAMLEQAQHHGVGVISIADPRSDHSYTKLIEPRRKEPSPAKIDGFIEDRFANVNKLALARWVRS